MIATLTLLACVDGLASSGYFLSLSPNRDRKEFTSAADLASTENFLLVNSPPRTLDFTFVRVV